MPFSSANCEFTAEICSCLQYGDPARMSVCYGGSTLLSFQSGIRLFPRSGTL